MRIFYIFNWNRSECSLLQVKLPWSNVFFPLGGSQKQTKSCDFLKHWSMLEDMDIRLYLLTSVRNWLHRISEVEIECQNWGFVRFAVQEHEELRKRRAEDSGQASTKYVNFVFTCKTDWFKNFLSWVLLCGNQWFNKDSWPNTSLNRMSGNQLFYGPVEASTTHWPAEGSWKESQNAVCLSFFEFMFLLFACLFIYFLDSKHVRVLVWFKFLQYVYELPKWNVSARKIKARTQQLTLCLCMYVFLSLVCFCVWSTSMIFIV